MTTEDKASIIKRFEEIFPHSSACKKSINDLEQGLELTAFCLEPERIKVEQFLLTEIEEAEKRGRLGKENLLTVKELEKGVKVCE